ncbi:DUF3055 domain-containing protein [Alkalicoccus chagannorensis]|uniref:DUF3055 domain-containing protein n=1 Tax=Alkalicoccus chagannorensis TaxID=427072 RepID=UPI00041999EB|nr:DUF3055 domain-containing protein [Alkalicoccus chagannorensis]
MPMYRELYNEHEKADVQFVGVDITGERYDFAVLHTSMFFGKVLIICMHTGRQALLEYHHLHDISNLSGMLKVDDEEDMEILAEYLREALKPFTPMPPAAAAGGHTASR